MGLIGVIHSRHRQADRTQWDRRVHLEESFDRVTRSERPSSSLNPRDYAVHRDLPVRTRFQNTLVAAFSQTNNFLACQAFLDLAWEFHRLYVPAIRVEPPGPVFRKGDVGRGGPGRL